MKKTVKKRRKVSGREKLSVFLKELSDFFGEFVEKHREEWK